MDYEARIVPYYRPIAGQLVRLARPRPGMTVIDVGAGTGLIARVLAPRLRPGGLLVLLDPAKQMLELARAHMPPGSTRYVLVTADAQDMHLGAEQFHLAVAQFSFLEDLPAAMSEVFRVLKPGGRLAMAMWGPNRLHDEYMLLKAAREEIGATAQPESSSVRTVAARLRRAGFVSVRSLQKYFPGVYANVETYIHYRDGFPWRSFVARKLWRAYMPAIARQAELRRDRRGRVVIRRSVTFLTARRPLKD